MFLGASNIVKLVYASDRQFSGSSLEAYIVLQSFLHLLCIVSEYRSMRCTVHIRFGDHSSIVGTTIL